MCLLQTLLNFFFFNLNRPIKGLYFFPGHYTRVTSVGSMQKTDYELQQGDDRRESSICYYKSLVSVDSSDSGTELGRSRCDSCSSAIRSSVQLVFPLARIEPCDSNRESCDSDYHDANSSELVDIVRYST